MALTHTTATRNAIADLIDDRVNGGGGAGKLKIYKTSIDNPTDANLLVALVFSATAFGNAAAGVITANSISTVNAAAAGTAAFFILSDSANTEILRGTVTATGGGGDITITNTSIAVGDPISVASAPTYTAPT